MAQRQCAFCHQPATTGEHVWSKWVNPLLGENRKYFIRRLIHGTDRKWVRVGLHEKFPVLCDPCNNEWGSSVETRMQLVSSSMVKDGAHAILGAEDIATIAVYSQLKAFVSDYAQEDMKSFYDFGDRRTFRRDFTFPSGTNMWLAKTTNAHGVFTSAYGKAPLNTPKRFYTYIFTMSLGQLVVQLTSVRWTKKSNRKYARPGNLTQPPSHWNCSIPFWPSPVTVPINWPPPQQLGREALNEFVYRWKTLRRTD
jgi:hypothetical protein